MSWQSLTFYVVSLPGVWGIIHLALSEHPVPEPLPSAIYYQAALQCSAETSDHLDH